MLDALFSAFDIPLIFLLIIIAFFATLIIKNLYNVFFSTFIALLILILVASVLLVQQIYLGEFLVLSMFFIFVIVFFILTLKNWQDEHFEKNKMSNIKYNLSILFFVLIFSIISINFYGIQFQKKSLSSLKEQSKTQEQNNPLITGLNKDVKNKQGEELEKEYDSYFENIALLNQNKIFQKLTHLIMFYVCLVIIFFFFNNKEEMSNER